MHELGRPRRRSARQVIHFTKENRIAASGGIARNTAAVNAAPYYREVENSIQGASPAFASSLWRFRFRF
jgi:hypothetical protein